MKNQEKSILGGVLGGLGGILGPKSQKRSARADLRHEFGVQVGAKIGKKSIRNRSKSNEKIDQKSIPEGLGAQSGMMNSGPQLSSSEKYVQFEKDSQGPVRGPPLDAQVGVQVGAK